LRIRRATVADIARIRELEQQSETAAHWSTSQYHALFSPDGPERVTLVAISDSAEAPIRGFLVALCLPYEWEVENIAVQQEFRRSGVGSSLVRGLLAEARTAGATSVLLEVRESNPPARLLYEEIGFKLEGRRRDYYRNPVEDALLFRFPLQSCDKIA